MRIIAGKYRGRKIKSPPDSQTRPTSDRLRETLFNILTPRIEGARFLDLCAGTGAVGIEALSRGASHVTFVDQSRRMCALIEANVDALGIDDDKNEIVTAEALAFLRAAAEELAEPFLAVRLLPRSQPFDIVFFDPPYTTNYESVLNYLGEHAPRILRPSAIVIVEYDKRTQLSDQFNKLKRYRELRQGDSILSFYRCVA